MPGLMTHIRAGQNMMAPGVGDALEAMLVERAGFPCLSISGYQVAACLGYPDVGIASMSEMVFQAARICAAVTIPVIADADNGHGNSVNTVRTVQEFEQAGAAAIHLEDQVLPKKCGFTGHQELVSASDMCEKIRAALYARRNPDFAVIARSDAFPIAGHDETVRRSRAYLAEGADAIMFVGARSMDDMKRFRDDVDGPLVTSVGTRFDAPAAEMHAIGYQVVMHSVTTLRRRVAALQGALAELRADGMVDHTGADYLPMPALQEVLGVNRVADLEARFAAKAGALS